MPSRGDGIACAVLALSLAFGAAGAASADDGAHGATGTDAAPGVAAPVTVSSETVRENAFVNSATVGTASGAATHPGPPATTAVNTLRTGEQIGTLRIPRFGTDWTATIAEGTAEHSVLASNVGHYPGTALPGGDGNFAIAGHRTSYHAPFLNIQNLVIGDAMIVETAEGWYSYRYRASEYVQPSAVDVLNAVPRGSEQPAGKYITLTACNPLYSTAERVIAYGVFERFVPRPS
ncbi:hypothetical protein GCM10027416_30710 [Okibacterium endophyticum]